LTSGSIYLLGFPMTKLMTEPEVNGHILRRRGPSPRNGTARNYNLNERTERETQGVIDRTAGLPG
jgi:hypothetical protein